MGNPLTRRSALPTGTLASPACAADPRLWYVSPSQLCGHRDRPVSITSPALEQLVSQLAGISALAGRPLGPEERQIVDAVFQTGVDPSRVRIVEARIASAPTTLRNQIRVWPGTDFLTPNHRGTLVHEMTHVWQYQTQGTGYITDALYHQVSSMIRTGDRNAAYLNYVLDDHRSITSYPAEEQAMIVEDYYELTVHYASDPDPPSWVAFRRPDLPRYERLIEQVRQSMPRSDLDLYESSLMHAPGAGVFGPNPGPGDHDVAPLIPLLMIRF